MESVLHGVQDLVLRCRSLFRSHGTVIVVTGVASLLALKALRLMRHVRLFKFLPILGFIPKSLDHLFHAAEIYADTYGDVYYMKTLGRDIVVVSDPELIREVLNARPRTYIKPFNKHKIMPMEGMFNTEGEAWKRNRRLGAPAFNDSNSVAMIPDMSKIALRLIRQLERLSQDGRELLALLEPCDLEFELEDFPGTRRAGGIGKVIGDQSVHTTIIIDIEDTLVRNIVVFSESFKF
ncbi:cytochrome p450, putative [Perkinsus marinus ATCC 50983]|uniref:Cytochrome p450, putative n=1 Tax=Perkinsus marinus (strain ATCC 50983 / TXsc) TaxID=423536 RepID=C5LW83_PERM5|nr:cytochrome p450, putative [Perkinsus marinus ATCC 50983]EEQ99020.1 cytochrome p450, putative [Perkinsus marinus ATCC 50983]|eukprot:XP_002766303.1 cytochrome p450, putative [Perkinsus marinus ATCC 50983]